jgi:hypothetical protein
MNKERLLTLAEFMENLPAKFYSYVDFHLECRSGVAKAGCGLAWAEVLFGVADVSGADTFDIPYNDANFLFFNNADHGSPRKLAEGIRKYVEKHDLTPFEKARKEAYGDGGYNFVVHSPTITAIHKQLWNAAIDSGVKV